MLNFVPFEFLLTHFQRHFISSNKNKSFGLKFKKIAFSKKSNGMSNNSASLNVDRQQ